MRKSRFTEEQIVGILKEYESGATFHALAGQPVWIMRSRTETYGVREGRTFPGVGKVILIGGEDETLMQRRVALRRREHGFVLCFDGCSNGAVKAIYPVAANDNVHFVSLIGDQIVFNTVELPSSLDFED